MTGTIELLRDHGADMPGQDRERFLANLSQDAERLGRLVHRLLELARADMLSASNDSCSASAVVDQLVERYRMEGATVATQGLDQLPAIRLGREIIEAVFCHLFDNAREHGGKDVAIVVRALPSEYAPDTIAIEVADDGPGVSDANRARIFEPFFTTTGDRRGTGMGLTIARALLRAHGGSLALVQSERGACFRMTLPRADAVR
jgi:signal transduction histidine kinase